MLCTLALAFGRDEDDVALALPHGDAMYYYVYLPSLWLDGDVDFENQYAVTGDPWQQRRTPTGRAGNVFGIGTALFESPLFLAGHMASRVGGGRSDGFSALAYGLSAWASVLASLGAVWFAVRLLQRRLGDQRRALAAALLAFAGGPVLFYAIRQPGMAHPFSTLFAAWLIDAWDRSYDRERTARTWIVLGALFGACVLARPQLVTWGVCLVAAGIADLVRGVRTKKLPEVTLRLLAGIGAVLLVLLPQLITWRANYGSAFVVPQGDHFMRWDAPAWSEVLFSSRNGLLPWSPLYAIALVGVLAAARRMPRLVGVLLLGLALQVVVNGAAWDWWAGGSFGARRFDSAYILFALGLGVVLMAARRHVALTVGAGIVVGWLVVSNVVLTLQTTPHSMRMKGGEPAADVFADKLGAFGAPVGWLSSLANLPARLAFTIQHDVGLDTYDRVVGVYWLAETYPELSTKTPRSSARRQVADIPLSFRTGFHKSSDVLASPQARVLIGLNRIGTVHVVVEASCEQGGPLALTWNGESIRGLAFDVEPVRGVNTLGIAAQVGCRVSSIELTTNPTSL